MTVKLIGSSSGSVALDAPASTTGGANIEFKLPVADGSNGQVIQTNGSGQLAFASVVGGLVGFKHKTATGGQNMNESSFADTNLTITYTPQNGANNKIYVLLSGQFEQDDSDNNVVQTRIKCTGQHTTNVPKSEQRVGLEQGGGPNAKSICQFLEDPNISGNSNITYTLQAYSESDASGDFRVRTSLAFTVFEIASGINQS